MAAPPFVNTPRRWPEESGIESLYASGAESSGTVNAISLPKSIFEIFAFGPEGVIFSFSRLIEASGTAERLGVVCKHERRLQFAGALVPSTASTTAATMRTLERGIRKRRVTTPVPKAQLRHRHSGVNETLARTVADRARRPKLELALWSESLEKDLDCDIRRAAALDEVDGGAFG
jgi:hypothetical protein